MRPALVLASASPQRRAILQSLKVSFTVRPTGVQEREQGPGAEVALQNALAKAQAAQDEHAHEAVLGVDTIVELDGVLYGKPADQEQARATLSALSGATHTVHSGVALLLPEEQRTAVASTQVIFREIDETLMERSLRSGEWQGRSGAYAIQGMGVALVRGVQGDYLNVVGLPVATLIDLWPQLLEC
ncbi:MAG TPA: Maf family protein [Solirubrobacteraceae bacterium]|nr:Maf family protein [Solirubrobacteraceae bacterium]